MKRLPDYWAAARRRLGTPQFLPGRQTSSAVRIGRKPTAIVAACYDFPIYSHGFVYQEMLGLRDMGFDLRLFCWRQTNLSQLHGAFAGLRRHVQVLPSSHEQHVADYHYFRARMPERVTALMQLLVLSLNRSPAELEQDHEVLMAFTFARAAEAAGADYIHTYFFYEETFFGLVTAFLLDVPRGVSCYADHMLTDSRYKDFALQFEHLDVAVATSRRIGQELAQLAGSHSGKILIKPNGVDGRRFQPRTLPEHMPEPLELLSVSRIEPKKGLLELCDVARILKDVGKTVRIHVVGAADPAVSTSNEYALHFAARRRELGVEDMFVMHGFRTQEQIRPLLHRAHAFIAPYVELESGDKDGIPTALLEAMASGLPAICTDAGSITEAIDDGVEGLLVPQHDPVRMAAAVLRLIDQPGVARELGLAAHRRFVAEFDARITEPRLHSRVQEIFRSRRSANGGAFLMSNGMNRKSQASIDSSSHEPVSRFWGFERGHPVDRYYIENFLERHASDIRGRTLELGDASYTRRYGRDSVTVSDVLHHAEGNPHANIVADLSDAPNIPSDRYDCIVFTQALHLIFDASAAIRTLHRVLKDGGVLLATFPGLTPVRPDDWVDEWYWSFTLASARKLFEQVFNSAHMQIQVYGNLVAATAFLQGVAAEELTARALDHYDPEYPVTITVRARKSA